MRARTLVTLLLAWILGCGGSEDPAHLDGAAPPNGTARGNPPDTLVIPADEPTWGRLDGLLDAPGGYGEASWDDVKMRVVQHVATIGRDRARFFAMKGDYAGCAAAYRDTVTRIDAIATNGATGAPIRAALRAAADRDATLCAALAERRDPPDPGAGVAHLRARWHALAARAARGEDVRDAATALAAEARAVAAPALDLDGFADFEARHALRVKLVVAWADAVDPLRPADPWGYWEPAEVTRVAAAVAAAADALATGAVPGADALVPARARVPFSGEALGALPTGDSYVDVAGFPGPRAIGTLAVLSLEDPAHRAWLTEQAAALEALPDAEVPAAIARVVATLDGKPYGSRYYNVKQARNAAIRSLASRGAYAAAREVLATSWPLHAQDWACPDRAAILRGIDGRLALASGDASAVDALDAAMAEADRFLAHVRTREAAGPQGPPPGPPGFATGPQGSATGPQGSGVNPQGLGPAPQGPPNPPR